jgi:hypothetical protein
VKMVHYQSSTLWSQCQVCGRDSSPYEVDFLVPQYLNQMTSTQSEKVRVARKQTGYLVVHLYDDTKVLACRECAEVLLSRQSVEPFPERPDADPPIPF